MTEIDLDPQRQRQAKRYARLSRRLMLFEIVVGLGYTLAWLLPTAPGSLPARLLPSVPGTLSHALKAGLLAITTNEWLLVALYVAVFGAVYTLITLPLSYYQGFVLPHRFGLSTQSLGGWVLDEVKNLAIGGLLGLVVLEVIYLVLRLFPGTWWLWAGGFLLLFSVVLANLAPVLLMPLFNKFTPLGEEHHDLAERLMQLARRADTRVQGVFTFDMSRRTTAANAALTGIGNTRRIILGDTLIKEFTPDEIETVMAHELGHHVHKDIPLGMAIQTVLTLVGLYLASLGLKWGVAYFGFQGLADIAAFPVLLLVLGAYSLLTMPLGNAFSRWCERRADAYALRMTGNGPAFASALTRLANQNLADVDPEPWVEWLLHSHPALSKRIAAAQAAARPPAAVASGGNP